MELYQHDPSLGQTQKLYPLPRLGSSFHIFDFIGARRNQPEPHGSNRTAWGSGVLGCKGDRQGWHGSTALAVAGAWQGQEHEAAPAQGFADPGKTKRDKTCLQDIFPLKNDDFCRKCLSAVNFQKEKKHTQKNQFVRIENKNLPDVPCSSLARPLEELLAEDREGKGSQKTFEEKY